MGVLKGKRWQSFMYLPDLSLHSDDFANKYICVYLDYFSIFNHYVMKIYAHYNMFLLCQSEHSFNPKFKRLNMKLIREYSFLNTILLACNSVVVVIYWHLKALLFFLKALHKVSSCIRQEFDVFAEPNSTFPTPSYALPFFTRLAFSVCDPLEVTAQQ